MRKKIIDQIANNIIKDKLKNEDIGLLSGCFGEIFFLYHCSALDSKYKNMADSMLDEYLDKVSEIQNMPHTYCTGISGVGIGMYILKDNGYIVFDDDFFDEIDAYLYDMLRLEIRRDYFDFLHGAIGIGFYFLKRIRKTNSEIPKQALFLLTDYLIQTAITDPNSQTVKWAVNTNIVPSGSSKFNISLSHGVSSIILFLSSLSEVNVGNKSSITDLLRSSVNYIISQKQDHLIYGSYFPFTCLEDTIGAKKSRLAWCYGDLGIAIALWEASKILHDETLSRFVTEIFLFSANRRDSVNELVVDAGLCHGSAGIAQFFYKMYNETNIPQLHDAYIFWDSATIDFAFKNGDFAEYKKYHPLDKVWLCESNLLEGSSGVGLSLLSALTTNWDEILLLTPSC